MASLRTLRDLDVKGKRVICRVDLNVPMKHGRVEDATRIERVIPTLRALQQAGAKVIVVSHFGRPKGEFVRDMSLAPLVDALAAALGGREVKFAVDCIGNPAQNAVDSLQEGQILLLENVRFHKGETTNDPQFARALASLGDAYVNDTFSCSHRAHASVVGVAELLPAAAGLLLQEEISSLERILTHPAPPMAAIVGGSKVSTKLELLDNLMTKVDVLAIGGAMANTFLKAQGHAIGTSLHEPDLVPIAKEIITKAKAEQCELLLPVDVVVTRTFQAHAPCTIVAANAIPNDSMVLDVGPETVALISQALKRCRTLVWNGPLGAFEHSPFDVGTLALARTAASLTSSGQLTSVAGGGDIVAALKAGGLTSCFSYISTAGGAFLEWLEGKELPGIVVLYGRSVAAA